MFGYVLTISQLMLSVYRIRYFCLSFSLWNISGFDINCTQKVVFIIVHYAWIHLKDRNWPYSFYNMSPMHQFCLYMNILFHFQISMNDQSMFLRCILGVLQLSSVTIAYGNFLFNVKLILVKFYSIHSKWWTSFFFLLH